MRIGHGYDVHRLAEGRKLILGGVHIPHDFGLDGHSDADVLAHAVMDALLGASALGDIGRMFPDKDPKYKGANSLTLLTEVVAKVKQYGYKIVNIDTILIAQRPKIASFVPQMCLNLAQVCDCDPDCISVKATTEERLGFTGREQGIAAHCICLIDKK